MTSHQNLPALLVRLCLAAALLPSAVTASTGRPGYGFIGYGISMYKPPCAFACTDSITAPLNCTDATKGHMDGMDMKRMVKRMDMGGDSGDMNLPSGDGWMVMAPTPECKVNDDFYLQTLAYCIKSRCPSLTIDAVESFWINYVAGRQPGQPVPKESYSQALAAITTPPTRELNTSIQLNYTAVVTDEQWLPNYNADVNFEAAEGTHERFGLVLFLTGAIIPIALSLLRFLPWPATWASVFNAYFIEPPLVGAKHAVPVWGFGVMPTRGQALFIGYILVINLVLCASGYDTIWPHSWYSSQADEVSNYIANRTGILSFANLPLLILYAGRNNILLWLTNWSHSTFLLIHRWVAFLCMLQAVIHSALYLQQYKTQEGYDYTAESQLPYWYWGIIATLALAVLIPASILPLRQKLYELFLASHIVLSILAVLGCYLHIYFRFNRQWGYETWIYMATAVWVFDRLARVFRFVRGGVKRVLVTVIDDDYIRLDIPGIAATGHVYLHFPTLSTWRIWENHPFSVAAITTRGPTSKLTTISPPKSIEGDKEAKLTTESSVADPSHTPDSASLQAPSPASSALTSTFFVRKHAGITSRLAAQAQAVHPGIPVLVEASYGPGVTFLQESPVHPTPAFPNVVCVAGGVGITAILPVLDHLRRLGRPLGAAKVFWGVRTAPLVRAVEEVVGVKGEEGGVRRWGDVEVVVSVGERFALGGLLGEELRGLVGGTTVVVCGPPGMADEVRCVVAGLGRHGVLVKLVVESFLW